MRYTNDPATDYLVYDTEHEERISKLPKCHYCGEHSEFVYIVPMGARELNYCQSCFDQRFRRLVGCEEEETVCDECGKVIPADEYFYRIAGETWCEECTDLMKEE